MAEQKISELSQQELLALSAELEEQYLAFKNRGVKLDMSRGRPAAAQLDIAMGAADGVENYIGINKFDYRNYGLLDGIPEMKQFFAELLELNQEEIIVGGNAARISSGAAIKSIVGSSISTALSSLISTLKPAPRYSCVFQYSGIACTSASS